MHKHKECCNLFTTLTQSELTGVFTVLSYKNYKALICTCEKLLAINKNNMKINN